jgi:hypothetical protein
MTIANAITACDLLSDGIPELQETVVTRIGRTALFKAMYGRFPDSPRCNEIRFADTKGDNIVQLRDKVKELSDTRCRKICDSRR